MERKMELDRLQNRWTPADLGPAVWWKVEDGVMMDMLTGKPLDLPGNNRCPEGIVFDRLLLPAESERIETDLAARYCIELAADEPIIRGPSS
jgi:hypothetical protein